MYNKYIHYYERANESLSICNSKIYEKGAYSKVLYDVTFDG